VSKTSKIGSAIAISNENMSKILGQEVSLYILFLDSNGNTAYNT